MPKRAAHLVAEHHVLADGEVGAEVDLLVDGRDAGGLGVGRAGDWRGCHRRGSPRVDLVDAGERLDERRLARTVLTHQGVHLAREQPEVDVRRGLSRRGTRSRCRASRRSASVRAMSACSLLPDAGLVFGRVASPTREPVGVPEPRGPGKPKRRGGSVLAVGQCRRRRLGRVEGHARNDDVRVDRLTGERLR